ncbi:hypothetical protein [Desulfoluna spongiiphila]|uniref:Uncharacterized protein n=1 Tax=Desulfoluna spongiiphila TaxID=419481 RepID=A0A1G5F2R1_9BACT|nr:hypothetical protein [Desulfoluna spongiiphila]SCY33487.1 hypothetical protein SAMN05216233_10797 [Desulfoluna spongiiphila]
METPEKTVTNPGLWNEKAVAATIKATKMLWGKHNETIQAWLYESGFSLETLREALLGWQVRNTRRPADSWGTEGVDKILLPEGITIPVIRDKELKRVVIFRMGHGHDGEYHTVEGSAPVPLVLTGSTPRTAIVRRELDALLLHQELKKEWTVVATGDLPPAALEDALNGADSLCPVALNNDTQALAPWITPSTCPLAGTSLVDLARQGALAQGLASVFK